MSAPRKKKAPVAMAVEGSAGESCRICAHWKHEGSDEGGDYGSCLRYPPVVLIDPNDGGAFSTSPVTEAGERCGEFCPGVLH